VSKAFHGGPLTISGIWQGTFFPKQAEIFRGSGTRREAERSQRMVAMINMKRKRYAFFFNCNRSPTLSRSLFSGGSFDHFSITDTVLPVYNVHQDNI
jgi:hypothetical protein